MSLPRMKPQDGVAWITGASSGIGEAVALELARRGWTVAVTARRLDLLEALARRSEGLPGRIVAHAGDVTDAASMKAVVEGIESVHGPIALAFLNAGVATGGRGETIDVAAFEQTFAVNVIGVVKAMAPVLERMKGRGRGQIAVNASVAGYRGLPGGTAYGASKAAAIYLCESLQFEAARTGVRVQVVNPGFVESPMTRDRPFAMPLIIPADEAARRIVDGFERGGFAIAFPRRLAWLLALIGMLPYPLYFALMGRFIGR